MRSLAVVTLLITAVLSLSACSPNPAKAQVATATAKASPATVATPIVRDIAVTQSYPAQVEAIERVELRPQVSGLLHAVKFSEGTIVSRGQVLFRIDPRPFAAALAEAQAALAQAKTEAEVTVREGERAARLLEKKAIAQEEAERRRASASVASARVAAALAAVERARLELSFTDVRSAITGRIGRAEVTRGNLVTPDTRLAVVVAIDPVYVRFDVDENTVASQLGTTREKWRVAFNDVQAKIAFVDNEIGHGTGTLRIRARLDNRNGNAIPGMYGTAKLMIGEEKNALLVRDDAIGADQGQRFVLIVDKNNTLQYRPVTLGAREGNLRVIKSGLTATDQVVINGLFRLRPGMSVAPNVVAMEKVS